MPRKTVLCLWDGLSSLCTWNHGLEGRGHKNRRAQLDRA
ncbi:hypothetical protein FTUN_6276 [Frigoriglobus tundricola]|uniref:Uncharacterized protein n=1 Tax=Frigoriglobus tundricola TaxID=2774151 RepID=A0A6M5YZN9_9BACT|nr:hypothetical protein FTUN_6276 [Frigoriglobus tundricola]